jgi:hypothetical protein
MRATRLPALPPRAAKLDEELIKQRAGPPESWNIEIYRVRFRIAKSAVALVATNYCLTGEN